MLENKFPVIEFVTVGAYLFVDEAGIVMGFSLLVNKPKTDGADGAEAGVYLLENNPKVEAVVVEGVVYLFTINEGLGVYLFVNNPEAFGIVLDDMVIVGVSLVFSAIFTELSNTYGACFVLVFYYSVLVIFPKIFKGFLFYVVEKDVVWSGKVNYFAF